jgi:hypothetical protein
LNEGDGVSTRRKPPKIASGVPTKCTPWRLTGSTLMWNQTTYLVPFSSSPENRFRKKTNTTSIRRHLLTWLSPTTVRKIQTCSKPLFLSTISSRSRTAPTSYSLSLSLETTIGHDQIICQLFSPGAPRLSIRCLGFGYTSRRPSSYIPLA